MERLLSVLDVLAWIGVITIPILLFLFNRIQKKYDGSIEEKINAMEGYTMNYTKNNVKYLITLIICLAIVISKYL